MGRHGDQVGAMQFGVPNNLQLGAAEGQQRRHRCRRPGETIRHFVQGMLGLGRAVTVGRYPQEQRVQGMLRKQVDRHHRRLL